MSSKLKKFWSWVRNIGFGTLVAVTLNQAAVLPTNYLISNLQKSKMSIEDAKKIEYATNEYYTQLDYTCMAYASKWHFKEKEGQWRGSSCGDGAMAIKEMYDFLVEKDNRRDLKDKLRIAQGIVIYNQEKGWHYWLELEMPEGYTKYFDSVSGTSKLKPPVKPVKTSDIEDCLNQSLEDTLDEIAGTFRQRCDMQDFDEEEMQLSQSFRVQCLINEDKLELTDQIMFTFARQNKYGVMMPTAESLLYPGGGLGLLYEFLDDKEDYMISLGLKPENIPVLREIKKVNDCIQEKGNECGCKEDNIKDSSTE